jgi:hypothetical protein
VWAQRCSRSRWEAPLRAWQPLKHSPARFGLAQLHPALGGDGSKGFVLTGASELIVTGYSVSGTGDINGDGIGDMIVGAPYGEYGDSGQAYVVFGRKEAAPVFDLARLLPENGGDGSEGFELDGGLGTTGYSVSDAGDVNGDGIDDIIVSAPGRFSIASGEAYVVFVATPVRETFRPRFSSTRSTARRASPSSAPTI